jgi:hypothetical protein
MRDIYVAVEVDDEVFDEMAVNPDGDYKLRLVQRDQLYNGTPDIEANLVFKVVQ